MPRKAVSSIYIVCPAPLAKRKGLLYTYGTISEEDERMLNLLDSAYIFDARRKENPIESAFVHDDKAAWHNAMKLSLIHI